ncbi:hypothetical protein RMR16_008690 [Agrobacterium sp. rho-13.3]|uniref:hypothetical protein n=1 Tax=Agrobacterium sp. rho-13.3 TaxID=3072980 RepID=UPI002A0CDA25|nr:hypothetical protein [Agrobacterium sp. rho-13.3]MDX8310027.1 hypothetical protein [Agrobacterium sp. rho-13.3]
MDDKNVSVSLIAPAKVNGVREPAGKTVTVSATLALQLAASGAINPELAAQLSQALDMSDTLLESDFQQAVENAAVDRIEVFKVKYDLEHAKLIDSYATEQREITDQLTEVSEKAAVLEGDLAAARRRYETAEEAAAEISADLAAEKTARAEAERKLADATAPKPAKTAK